MIQTYLVNDVSLLTALIKCGHCCLILEMNKYSHDLLVRSSNEFQSFRIHALPQSNVMLYFHTSNMDKID